MSNRQAPWESEHGTVDVEKYNLSLKHEPERDKLRMERTTAFLRERVVRDTPSSNGAHVNNGYPFRVNPASDWPE